MPRTREVLDCPCGRKIAKPNQKMHAGACEKARAAGWKPPPVRVSRCECGCKERIESYSTKPSRFVNHTHYDKWRRKRPGKAEKTRLRAERWRKNHEPRRTIEEARAQHEEAAMSPVQAQEEELLALYEHSNATFFTSPTYWDSERIRREMLSWRQVA